jgi:hypothetical protein
VNCNRDGHATDVDLAQDVDNVGISGCGVSAGDTPVGFDDWANVVFSFRAFPDFADGGHASAGELTGAGGPEIDVKERLTP